MLDRLTADSSTLQHTSSWSSASNPPDVYTLSVEPLGYTQGPYVLDAAIDTLHDLYATHKIQGGFVWRPSAIRERIKSEQGKDSAVAWFGVDTRGVCQTAFLRRVPKEPQRCS